MKIVVLDSLFESLDLEREVAAQGGATLEGWDGEPASLAEADVVVHVRTRVDASLISSLHRCKVIARFGTGLDSVDTDAARAAGINVLGVRDYCLPELCTQTLALGFSLLRRVPATAGRLDAAWSDVAARSPLARSERVAVVGFGSAGRRVTAALLALGYRVTVVSAHAAAEAEALGAEVAELDDALARSELVFLHAALTEATRQLIDARRLALLPPGAILVDTARLGLLDEEAVAAALESGRLGGLGLDASLPTGSPLRRFAHDPRVLITPHLGWYSETSAAELRRRAIESALERARELEQLEVSPR